MKSKLESCVLHDHVNPDKTFIPDRLIDVRENRLSLVLTKNFQPRDAEVQRYIALTYCWGPEPHASKQRKTTTVNISQHRQQIPEFSLPQVIKDAVAATRALSIPFLWVDALCILQDDISDWTYQDLLKSLKTPSPYIARSWSWASQREWFTFDLYHSNLLADCRPEFDSLDTAITLRGESVFGEVRDGALDITSKVYVGSQRITYHKAFRQFDPPQETVRFDGRYFAHIKPDCSAEDIFESPETRTLAAPINANFFSSTHSDNSETLGGDSHAGFDYQSSSTSSLSAESGGDLETETRFERAAYGLLIHPAENSNGYYRVGTFFSKPHVAGGLSFFDNVIVRTVRLV
ncbi:hypothetical protein FOC4_g10002870 [Fusarium odoratissimum]|uniref:Heterokaryon incompatibility domain-containing protein n=1 Tax=Fusarium oxysporum f. sp. cubense (strain race 4) TaxID=2502994 RepID=N1SBP1_FUSC4|nr:hypothetical protein FOC4_g10002870 [Fusarium odoratissimum]